MSYRILCVDKNSPISKREMTSVSSDDKYEHMQQPCLIKVFDMLSKDSLLGRGDKTEWMPRRF